MNGSSIKHIGDKKIKFKNKISKEDELTKGVAFYQYALDLGDAF